MCTCLPMRLSVPCRAESCAHLQCFDAVFYLQMNEKKPTWMCPVCDKPATYDQLMIDGLLSKILTECEDADEIEYLVDGSWCPIKPLGFGSRPLGLKSKLLGLGTEV
uniref:SP-RING-type domain-containing protein n=1 Tax=Anolis carolinensis TaxID=28377 RepID=H9GRA1_ANOCA